MTRPVRLPTGLTFAMAPGHRALPERPSIRHMAVEQTALRRMADMCLAWAGSRLDHAAWMVALRVACHGESNAYRMARTLEDHYHISPDHELVAVLTGWSALLIEAGRQAEMAWVARNEIRPALGIGDACRFEGHSAVVGRIDPDRALYSIVIPGLHPSLEDFLAGRPGAGGLTAPFEAVEAA